MERRPPPWIFGLTNIPFGAAAGFCAVTMPFLLRRHNISVATITAISAAALIPSSYQFLWAPVIDIGPKRRTWLTLVSAVGAICMAAAMFLELPKQLHLFEVLIVAGQAFTGLVGSCNGGLMATTLPDELRGKASGWLNAANLGGAALGGGVVLYLARVFSPQVAGIGLGLIVFLPSLVALTVKEKDRPQRSLREVFGSMIRDVWGTLKVRQGWTGVLFCLSPVGTAAMQGLFSAIADDYHAPEKMVEIINGYWGGLITAFGALVSGYFLDRINKRAAYLLAGALTAAVGIGMSFLPLTPTGYTIGSLVYLLVTGLCYAAFTAVVLDIIGNAGHSAATQYTLFTAAGNQAIAYVTWFNGKGYDWFKNHGHRPTSGMLLTDAGLNLLGIAVLSVMLLVVFRQKKQPEPAMLAG
jgi:PAT family beta-lactamase induction signal transducer AmpG